MYRNQKYGLKYIFAPIHNGNFKFDFYTYRNSDNLGIIMWQQAVRMMLIAIVCIGTKLIFFIRQTTLTMSVSYLDQKYTLFSYQNLIAFRPRMSFRSSNLEIITTSLNYWRISQMITWMHECISHWIIIPWNIRRKDSKGCTKYKVQIGILHFLWELFYGPAYNICVTDFGHYEAWLFNFRKKNSVSIMEFHKVKKGSKEHYSETWTSKPAMPLL